MSQPMSPDDIPRSLGRALDLLETVLATQGCTLTAAAQATGLTPTTALRHLRGLEARGYVERDAAGVFLAGPAMRRAAAATLDRSPLEQLLAVAQPHLDALAVATGESCYIAVADEGGACYVATAESTQPIRHVGWVGQHVTLDGTAVGAALSDPGTLAIRTGAVEPDVTAISLALPTSAAVPAAVSVIGPDHRLRGGVRADVERELERMVAELTTALGITPRAEVVVG